MPKIRNPFTLIELLVVIAIIGILASMLLPELSKGKKAAQQAVSMNNIKTLYTSLVIYSDSYKGYAPKPQGNNTDLGGIYTYTQLLYHDMTDRKKGNALKGYYDLFYCPYMQQAYPAGNYTSDTSTSYSLNKYFGNVNDDPKLLFQKEGKYEPLFGAVQGASRKLLGLEYSTGLNDFSYLYSKGRGLTGWLDGSTRYITQAYGSQYDGLVGQVSNFD